MSKEEGNNSFLWGSRRRPVLSNSANQTASESTAKRNQKEKENKKLATGTANNNKKLRNSKGTVEGEVSRHGKGISREDNKNEKESESDHEIHIWTERERRKKMRDMFTNLHALLPQVQPKADKSTIIDEAVNFIKTLEEDLQKLEEKKLEKERSEATKISCGASSSREAFLADQIASSDYYSNSNNVGTKPSNLPPISRFPVSFQTWTSSNVVLNICGDAAQINVCSAKQTGLFTAICYILDKHNIEISSAELSSNPHCCLYMIQAHVDEVPNQLGESIPVEEIYKQAAVEIMGWISS